MKRFLTAFFLACLSLFVSCGTKGPQIVQKEGFVLVHDTLSLDLRPLVLPGCRLSFEQAVKVGEDYLCLFQQQNVYDRVAPETGSFHEVAQPCPVMAEERLVMCKDTVYLIVEQPTGQYRFIPEEETWEDGSFNEDVVYEDADWRVVTRDIRYAGSHTWFIERKTGKEYFFFTKPGQILPYRTVVSTLFTALSKVAGEVSKRRRISMLSARVTSGVGANTRTAFRIPCSMRPFSQKDICTKWLQLLLPPMSRR